MFEKVNPSHPDKLADRIAGAIIDLAYSYNKEARAAVEVLLGHGKCHVIIETSILNDMKNEISKIVNRIAPNTTLDMKVVKQDPFLQMNQFDKIRCGDNGIFKGVPLSEEERLLADIARELYDAFPYDGKYILDKERLIICQSNVRSQELERIYPNAEVNPLGYWTGGYNVDTGCTNRKLGSDMARSITGGGLHGKDLTKADVTLNIHAFLKAQETGKAVELSCAIGDEYVDGIRYAHYVDQAREFIDYIGGFEKFAEWGLV